MNSLPCWLCGKTLDIRSTKGGKLYVVCDPCGLQCFVRREQGMQRLNRLAKILQKSENAFQQKSESLFAIQGILREVDGLKKEIALLEDKAGFFFPDDELIRARDALQKRVSQGLTELEHLVANK